MEPDSNATAAAAANMSVMYGKGFQKRVLSLSIKKHECVHFCKEINRPRANYVSLKPNEHTLEISYIGETSGNKHKILDRATVDGLTQAALRELGGEDAEMK